MPWFSDSSEFNQKFETKYSKMKEVKFVGDSLKKISNAKVCLNSDCLPQMCTGSIRSLVLCPMCTIDSVIEKDGIKLFWIVKVKQLYFFIQYLLCLIQASESFQKSQLSLSCSEGKKYLQTAQILCEEKRQAGYSFSLR